MPRIVSATASPAMIAPSNQPDSLLAISLLASPAAHTISLERLLYYDYQWMMVFSIPFILMYNGQRGPKNDFTKYLFYVFYPAHVWALYLAGRAMVLGMWR